VATSATTCSDLANSVSFNAGDLLSIRYTETNGATNTRVRLGFRYAIP
jgi:hypothetical protein